MNQAGLFDRPTTYGPAYTPALDEARVAKQHEVIRNLMLLAAPAWLTLGEIESETHYPQASISAQLRHLRKKKFGSWRIDKRRRTGAGLWEYRIGRN